jgi:hypothetical protein
MYHKGILAGGAGTALGTLPFTGLNMSWVVIAAFALMMAAAAVWRIVPRTQA